MKRTLIAILGIPAVLAAVPAAADETLFRGRDIDLPQRFVCGGKNLSAGRYGLEVGFDRQTGASRLTVFRKAEDLCVVSGERSSELDGTSGSRSRLFTRVNAEKGAIQINLVVPAGLRSTSPSQVFYLPLAEKN